jgi:5-methylcytosine-specific restriction protein A
MFIKNKIYNRRDDLHSKYGGQMQGGISTPSKHNFIMLFTSNTGEQYGYNDGWNANGEFIYTGEGQQGNMSFVRGNLAILRHSANDKPLHLFKYVSMGHVKYIGQMQYKSHEIIEGNDVHNSVRKIIVFTLIPSDG